MNLVNPRDERGYIPIADHGLIGNLRTAALVSIDGSIESYCVPNFDSPSVFARILDKDKGGHFSIMPTVPFSTKQNYLASSNVLQTKYMNEKGVVSVTDYLPRPRKDNPSHSASNKPLLPWLIRRIECIRGSIPIQVQCAPAFNYALASHETSIIDDDSLPSTISQKKAVFVSPDLTLDLRYVVENTSPGVDGALPEVVLEFLDLSVKGHKGLAVQSTIRLEEGQCVTFILRTPPARGMTTASAQNNVNTEKILAGTETKEWRVAADNVPRAMDDPLLTKELLAALLHATNRYWYEWVSQSTYKGSWKEAVMRSALALKLLVYEPTGAVIASPTFSLPEYIGGIRNWDYRFSWIRDSSFTLYALIRLGFTEEANTYLEFIFERLRNKNADGSLQIMYTIHGGKEIDEIELGHLDGHKGSRPVRIGNGAADHIQLDIYGELMDCIYLGQKFGKPLSYDDWKLVRELVDYVVSIHKNPDLSIWEVRGEMKNFTYSKVMLWVAIDRGLRLADKRSFPCPNRSVWLAARDGLYEEIMEKAWNEEHKWFGQSYEENGVLDSAVLIMPLVFFMHASDPRFVSTLNQIMKTPEKGGLTSNNLVYRYDVKKSDDGVGGEEGTFCLCTLWCIEALTRAGEIDRRLLPKAVNMFEDFLLYLNHVGLCTEEISDAGEALGNAVQGFTHVTLISAAYNLSRTLDKQM
ncbi:glycoside hydrolase family 15 protein [Hypholoma sublateritium FD-334 SS-4]|uniref:Glycoside hydrolase family 15 protein n=1 Tax=Hypholoma sublateritium (strain FD-334 SS-4) TaxID=945553 RepID=A0A0D2P5C7_HYPSF|nr:glycoside hydrolase family 15 protein [Hypholoma sublateritium FD-334 SS-4]